MESVVVQIPVPKDVVSLECSDGNCLYDPGLNRAVWKTNELKDLGNRRFFIKLSVPSIRDPDEGNWKADYIRISFSVPSVTLSGVNLEYCKVISVQGYPVKQKIVQTARSGCYLVKMT
jgi:hypothetical protein